MAPFLLIRKHQIGLHHNLELKDTTNSTSTVRAVGEKGHDGVEKKRGKKNKMQQPREGRKLSKEERRREMDKIRDKEFFGVHGHDSLNGQLYRKKAAKSPPAAYPRGENNFKFMHDWQ